MTCHETCQHGGAIKCTNPEVWSLRCSTFDAFESTA